MSAIIGRAAFRATRPLRFQAVRPLRADQVADKQASKDALKQAGKKDPELYVLWTVMAGAFGLAGWYFSRSPTSSTSEKSVPKVAGSEPWMSGSDGKYQYYPGGDSTQAPRDAPSALNTVIIPNVNLPKELHEKYNKYGKEGY
ncbi:uncharacterized protein BKCO1_7000132 [Diplodia corticola]|uniref:Uncharacterized protein n=1 Tax=Diplodia corticola TaxID=236234 RepID=A0A1J9RA00_9PEZI|nr:uncharacterized protein BKCO1_7000132 [Diplodia corticola]OJD37368.1 hypothetical protein BKCO1_7000132 [Diplodia corticola]